MTLIFSCAVRTINFEFESSVATHFSGGMHSRTAIRFYEIHTPLTEAVLLDGRNLKQFCLCVISYYEEKWEVAGK
jgi:hypothetical protein